MKIIRRLLAAFALLAVAFQAVGSFLSCANLYIALASFVSEVAGGLVSAMAGVARNEVASINAGIAIKSLRFIF